MKGNLLLGVVFHMVDPRLPLSNGGALCYKRRSMDAHSSKTKKGSREKCDDPVSTYSLMSTTMEEEKNALANARPNVHNNAVPPTIEELEQEIHGAHLERRPRTRSIRALLVAYGWKCATAILAILLLVSWYFGIQVSLSSPKYDWHSPNALADDELANRETNDKNANAEEALAPPTPDEVTIGTTAIGVDDDAAIGDEHAPITMIEFTDYECSYCEKHATQTVPNIIENYVDQGKIRYVVRDYPLSMHEFASQKAQATECADDQQAFWSMHDWLFENQDASADELANGASELNLDVERFTQCLDSKKYEEEVRQDIQQAEEAGIKGTPSFIINGRVLTGAVPYETFTTLFEELLASEGEGER